MRDYFYGRFPSQLGQLAFRRPNEVVRDHIIRDPAVVFFGGPDWENVAADVGTVPENDRPRLQDRGEGKRGEHQLRDDLSALRRELRRTDAAVLALERIASEGLPKSPRR